MIEPGTPDIKTETLQRVGAWNPRPEDVTDELFLREKFFDVRDLVQVKYEMLRRVLVEGKPVSNSAAAFGFSRPTFYRVQGSFEAEGLPGLLPRQRGPQGPHKVSPEIREFLLQTATESPELRTDALAARVMEKFGVTLHPKTVARTVGSKKNE